MNTSFSNRIKTIFLALTLIISTISFAEDKPRIALIIDDFGLHPPESDLMMQFAYLDCPFAAAIIPGLAYSTQLAELFHQAGKEVIIHLPMESALPETVTEPLTLTVSMTTEEMRAIVFKAIYDIPFASGISNHQGSLFTGDKKAMNRLVKILDDTTLYFFDSLTAPGGTAYKTCRSNGIPSGKRDVFLDTDYTPGDSFDQRLKQFLNLARQRGYAIAVAHRYPETLASLQAFLGSDEAVEFEFVYPSELIDFKVFKKGKDKRED